MKGFIQGINRNQGTLFPEHLEDFVTEDNPVRIVDVFVEQKRLNSTWVQKCQPISNWTPSIPSCSSSQALHIRLYLNCIQSSRRLERESQRNLELFWLTEQLKPDFKTIANFRKDNGPAIRKVCS